MSARLPAIFDSGAHPSLPLPLSLSHFSSLSSASQLRDWNSIGGLEQNFSNFSLFSNAVKARFVKAQWRTFFRVITWKRIHWANERNDKTDFSLLLL